MLDNTTQKVPYISLCTGYEGIGIGLKRAIPNLLAVAYCEREDFAICNLVSKTESQCLDAAPIYTDVTTFPFQEFYPVMGQGIVSAGFPCQPVSCAGKRKVTEDERWLFDILCDGFALMQPGLIFLENVDGLLSAKMPDGSLVIAHIVTRLESMGYTVKAGVFSAAEVGAPHQRKRVFILAKREAEELGNSADIRLRGFCEDSREAAADTGRKERRVHEPARAGSLPGDEPCATGELAHHLGEREQEFGDGQSGGAQLAAAGHSGASLWPSRPGEESLFTAGANLWPSRPGERQHCWEPPRVCSAGTVDHARRNGSERSSGDAPKSSDNGKDDGLSTSTGKYLGCKTQPTLGRDTHGNPDRLDHAELHHATDNRVDELRLLGNGVVPATAELAWRTLYAELMADGSRHGCARGSLQD